jgi:hypothetical protein
VFGVSERSKRLLTQLLGDGVDASVGYCLQDKRSLGPELRTLRRARSF